MEMIKKPPRTNIIVNYLPGDMTDKELYDLFVVHGKIDYHKVVRDKATGSGLGYGFVDFVYDISAEAARRHLNGHEYNGKRLKVEYARPRHPEYTNTNLFVSFLRRSVNEDQLRSLFGRYGRIIQLKILVDKATGKSRGMAFVRFERHAAAQKAVEELHMRHKVKGAKRPITVQFSKQRFQADRNALPMDKAVERPSGFYAQKEDDPDEPELLLGLLDPEVMQEQEQELKSEEEAEEQKLLVPEIEVMTRSQEEDDPDELPAPGNTSSKLMEQFRTFCKISCDSDDDDWVGEAEEEEPERLLGLPELETEGNAPFPEEEEAEEEWLNAQEVKDLSEWSGLGWNCSPNLMEEFKTPRDDNDDEEKPERLRGLLVPEIELMTRSQEEDDPDEMPAPGNTSSKLMEQYKTFCSISYDCDYDDWVEAYEEEEPERLLELLGLLGLPNLVIEGKALFPEPEMMQEQEQELKIEEEAEEEWLNAHEVEDLFEWSGLGWNCSPNQMEEFKIPRDYDDDDDWVEDPEEEKPERLRGLLVPEIELMTPSQKEDDPDEMPAPGNTSSKLMEQYKTFCSISYDCDYDDWVEAYEEEEPERLLELLGLLGLPNLVIEGKALFPEPEMMQEQEQELKIEEEAEEEWLNAQEVKDLCEWSGLGWNCSPNLMEEFKTPRNYDDDDDDWVEDPEEEKPERLRGLLVPEIELMTPSQKEDDPDEMPAPGNTSSKLMEQYKTFCSISYDCDYDDWVEAYEEEEPERLLELLGLLGLPNLVIEGKALFPEPEMMQEQEQELKIEEEAEEEWLNAQEVKDLCEWSGLGWNCSPNLMEEFKTPRDDNDDEKPERLRGLLVPEIELMTPSQKEDDPDEMPAPGNTSSKLMEQYKTFCSISYDCDYDDWVEAYEEEEPERLLELLGLLGLPNLVIEGKALFPEPEMMQEQEQELKIEEEAEEEWLNAHEVEDLFEWAGLGWNCSPNLMEEFKIPRDYDDDDDDWVEDPEEEKPERLRGLLVPEIELMTPSQKEDDPDEMPALVNCSSNLMEEFKTPRDDNDDDDDWVEDPEEEKPEPEIVVMSLFPYPEPEMEVGGYELDRGLDDLEEPLSEPKMLLLMLQVVIHLTIFVDALLKVLNE